MPWTVDVAIVGGGMVGASLALALADTGLSMLLIEGTAPGRRSAQPSFDDRTTALGNASRRIFQALGVWPAIAPQRRRHPHHPRLRRRALRLRAPASRRSRASMRSVTSYRTGSSAPRCGRSSRGCRRASRCGCPPAPKQVEITTDGVRLRSHRRRVRAKSSRRAWSSPPMARTRACVPRRASMPMSRTTTRSRSSRTSPPIGRQDGTAYERFTPSGPLAVLPLHDGSYGSSGRRGRTRRAGSAGAAMTTTSCGSCRSASGGVRDDSCVSGRRASYPLKLSRATTTVATRTVLIGNAAQALHPVAGQGFNLGLRDAAILAELHCECRGRCGFAGSAGAILTMARCRSQRCRAIHRRSRETVWRHAPGNRHAAQSRSAALRPDAAREECSRTGQHGIRRSNTETCRDCRARVTIVREPTATRVTVMRGPCA